MTVLEMRLPYERPPLSLNGREHWRLVAVAKRQLKNDVYFLALQGHWPKGLGKASVTLTWNPSDKRRRDSDNPTPTLKACIDGLVNYGLLPDDSSEFVDSRCVIGDIRVPAELWLRVDVPE